MLIIPKFLHHIWGCVFWECYVYLSNVFRQIYASFVLMYSLVRVSRLIDHISRLLARVSQLLAYARAKTGYIWLFTLIIV